MSCQGSLSYLLIKLHCQLIPGSRAVLHVQVCMCVSGTLSAVPGGGPVLRDLCIHDGAAAGAGVQMQTVSGWDHGCCLCECWVCYVCSHPCVCAVQRGVCAGCEHRPSLAAGWKGGAQSCTSCTELHQSGCQIWQFLTWMRVFIGATIKPRGTEASSPPDYEKACWSCYLYKSLGVYRKAYATNGMSWRLERRFSG